MAEIVDSMFDFKPLKWYKSLYYRIYRYASDTKYFFKKLYQRFKYGFPLEESWDFKSYCAAYCVPRLKHLRDNLNGYPSSLPNSKAVEMDENAPEMDAWRDIIDRMIWSFEHMDDIVEPIYSDDFDKRYLKEETEEGTMFTSMNKTGAIDWTPVREHNKRVQEGIDLFAKHFQDLWD